MNPQEKELLARFLEQLTTAQAGQKDREAESLIREAVARQPDAAYLLVQRALQLDQALQLTQAEAPAAGLEPPPAPALSSEEEEQKKMDELFNPKK